MKKVILSMDVEDWYHLDYFKRSECDKSSSLLDGLDVYVDLLSKLSLPSSFFVLGEIAENRIDYFKDLASLGHDIGSHGWNHKRPLSMSTNEFRNDLNRCMIAMKEINDDGGVGYRAPCFSLNRERLDIIKDTGFIFDSSRIEFGNHPLYGSLEMSGYTSDSKYIYQKEDFLEFEVTTYPVLGKNIPISGGGYLRLFPWQLMKELVTRHLKKNDIYILYIHPFELSKMLSPEVPSSTSLLTKFRFMNGRSKVVDRLKLLIDLLDSHEYEFTTFRAIHEEITMSSADIY
ncbi:polysaccharide deacetylase family protein [Gammaproteobacteria bacterium]|nr:polysaccharide deacetylase family protein [Gammaproteobacteria bacterium]